MARKETKTGGRAETSGIIPGDFALSVGRPDKEAPTGWRWIKLTDVARLETGHTPSRRHPEYWDGDIPWVGIRDATANHGGVLHSTNQYTNALGIANSSARILPENTVCLSRTASVGYVVVMGCQMATSQDFVNWVCDETKIDYNFLKYVLLAERRSFDRFSSGTTHQTIYFPEVKAFHVCLPSLGEQLTISQMLGALDAKIELNRQMNTTLESMAQALFRSWFVDFDPVIDNALAAGNRNAGRPIPDELAARAERRKQLHERKGASSSKHLTPGQPLPAAIRQQFPDRFVFTEALGWVPEGWEEGTLEDMIILQRGFDLPKTKRMDGGYPLMAASGQDGTHNEFKAKGPGVTTGRSGKLGEVNFVHHDFWPLNTTLWIKEYKNSSPYHALYLLRSLDLAKYNSGSAVPTLNRNYIHNISLTVPALSVVTSYDNHVRGLYKKMEINSRQEMQLIALRDTLLPKLLSGQLRIPEAEQHIAEVI